MLNLPEFLLPKSASEARLIQDELRDKVRLENDFADINLIAGIDVGYDPKRGLAHASIAIISTLTLKPIEQVESYVAADFPYIPGLLSFREIPAILSALSKLNNIPQLFMVDGQGIAHPKRLGIASHLGVITNMPSIGVAKSRLTGNFTMPELSKGDTSPLMHGKDRIGTVLRSKDNVKPLFISPGHRVDVETALEITQKCLTRYRLPEPTRIADKFSKCKTKDVLLC